MKTFLKKATFALAFWFILVLSLAVLPQPPLGGNANDMERLLTGAAFVTALMAAYRLGDGLLHTLLAGALCFLAIYILLILTAVLAAYVATSNPTSGGFDIAANIAAGGALAYVYPLFLFPLSWRLTSLLTPRIEKMRGAMWVEKLFPKPDVKLILQTFRFEVSVIREKEQGFQLQGPSAGLHIVEAEIKNAITFAGAKLTEELRVRNRPPREIVLWAFVDVCHSHIATGRHHTWRGLLSMQGNGLRSLWGYALDELRKMEKITEEDRAKYHRLLAKDVEKAG